MNVIDKVPLPIKLPTKVAKIVTLTLACLAQFLDIYNLSAINIALPDIGKSLNFTSTSDLQWLISGYALVFAAFLLAFGRLGDQVGHRRIFMAGLLWLGIFSLVNALATSPIMLIISRALAGIGAAASVPNAVALITTTFTEEKEKSLALSMFGAVGACGFVLGVIISGIVVGTLGWRWIFWISFILCIFTLIMTFIFVPSHNEHRDPNSKTDWPGVILSVVGLILIVFCLSDGQWGHGKVLDPVLLVVGVGFLVAFVWVEGKVEQPLMPLRYWRDSNFAACFLVSFVVYIGFQGFFFVITLLYQNLAGLNAIQTAIRYLPTGILGMLLCNATGWLIPRTGTKPLMVVGFLFAIASFILAIFIAPNQSYWSIGFPAFILFALGLPITWTAAQNAMIAPAPADESGTIGGLFNVASQVGSGLGTAIITAVIQGTLGGDPSATAPGSTIKDPDALLHAYRAGLETGLAFLILGLIVSLIWVKNTKAVKKEGEDEGADLEKGQGQVKRHGSQDTTDSETHTIVQEEEEKKVQSEETTPGATRCPTLCGKEDDDKIEPIEESTNVTEDTVKTTTA